MCEITEQQTEMERNTSEVSHDDVFYSCVHDSCKDIAPNIFYWLQLPFKPKVLKPGSNNVAAIIILQHDRGRKSDDISAILNEYSQYVDKKIIVLSLTTHDAEDHTKRFCTEDTLPSGNITFLKIHQRTNGYIHECRGNQACKDLVQSVLGITKQMDFQSVQNIVECDALLNGLRQFTNYMRQSSVVNPLAPGADNPVTDCQVMKTTSTNNTDINGSCSSRGWMFDKLNSLKERLLTNRGGCEANCDQDINDILQKIQELIQCLEKWKHKQSSIIVESDQLEVLIPKVCKQAGQEQKMEETILS